MPWTLPRLSIVLALGAGCAVFGPRQTTIGVGPGVVGTTGMPEGAPVVHPSVVVEVGSLPPREDHGGLLIMSSMQFHDFETIGNVYDWYFSGSSDIAPEIRYAAMWPLVVVAPLTGASLDTGMGVHLPLSRHEKAPAVDLGGQFGVWTNWSDQYWKVDTTLGVFTGMQAPLSRGISAGARGAVALPSFHALVHDPNGMVWSARLFLDFRPEARKERRKQRRQPNQASGSDREW